MSQQPIMDNSYGMSPNVSLSDYEETPLYEKINQYTNQFYSRQYYQLIEKRKELPIWKYKAQFLKLLMANNVVLLVGETGSGKSTQIPQWCLEYRYSESKGGQAVACTQPRRITAVNIAEIAAKEMDVALGSEVGYSIRFDNKTSATTLLKYLTDGMLLREAMNDSQLKEYGVIILDEVHERTADSDILMGLLKQLVVERNDLKVVIMSATLKVEKFKHYFNDAPLMKIPGRNYDIEIIYENEDKIDYFEASISKVIDIHTQENEGDILLFMTGQAEIENACEYIEERVDRLRRYSSKVGELWCMPLYSLLPSDMQQQAFEQGPENEENGAVGRKVIVATNVAETSLTIDGIAFVVDCGYSKQKRYNPATKVESLDELRIDQASAVQRAGRAGRTRPGKCYRMYTESKFNNQMQEQRCPEILRTNLASVLLKMKKIGFGHLSNFKFMDSPRPESLSRAEEILTQIGALNVDRLLTSSGKLMTEFPVDPQLAKMLLASAEYNCQKEIMTITAMLSISNCFLRPKKKANLADLAKQKFEDIYGDHLTLQKVYDTFVAHGKDHRWCKTNFLNYNLLMDAHRVRKQLVRIMENLKLLTGYRYTGSETMSIRIRKAIISGFYMQVARHSTSRRFEYQTTKDNQQVKIHPSSCLFRKKPIWVIYNDCLLSKHKYIKTVTEIQYEWLHETAPQYHV